MILPMQLGIPERLQRWLAMQGRGNYRLSRVSSTASNNYHQIKREVVSITAGTRQTFQGFVKLPSGSTNYSCYFRMANQYNNDGMRAMFRLDGSDGFSLIKDSAILTNGVFHYRKLSSGIYLVALTGTWVTSSKRICMWCDF